MCVSSAPRCPSGTQAEDCSAPFTTRLSEVAPEAVKCHEPGLGAAHLMFSPINWVDIGHCTRGWEMLWPAWDKGAGLCCS